MDSPRYKDDQLSAENLPIARWPPASVHPNPALLRYSFGYNSAGTVALPPQGVKAGVHVLSHQGPGVSLASPGPPAPSTPGRPPPCGLCTCRLPGKLVPPDALGSLPPSRLCSGTPSQEGLPTLRWRVPPPGPSRGRSLRSHLRACPSHKGHSVLKQVIYTPRCLKAARYLSDPLVPALLNTTVVLRTAELKEGRWVLFCFHGHRCPGATPLV